MVYYKTKGVNMSKLKLDSKLVKRAIKLKISTVSELAKYIHNVNRKIVLSGADERSRTSTPCGTRS